MDADFFYIQVLYLIQIFRACVSGFMRVDGRICLVIRLKALPICTVWMKTFQRGVIFIVLTGNFRIKKLLSPV